MIHKFSHLKLLSRNLVNITRTNFCSDDDFKKQSKVQITNENAQ